MVYGLRHTSLPCQRVHEDSPAGVTVRQSPHSSTLKAAMFFLALAVDYDGTIACDGKVDAKTVAALEKVKALIHPGETVMVDLDAAHDTAHVLQELQFYGKLVTKGNYLIVEDTNLGTIVGDLGQGGPLQAVQEFLKQNGDFVPDPSREKFLLSFNTGGYLRKIR